MTHDACNHEIKRLENELSRLRAVNAELVEALSSPELLETLAALEHERWSGWMKYQAEKAGGKHPITGEPYEIRWKRQSETPYARLPEQERESDRVEARKTLAAILSALSRAAQVKPETCVWRGDILHGYQVQCGYRPIFGDGVSTGKCPGCGKRIEVKK